MADLERGDRIQGLRNARHMTQEAAADAIGITLRAYQEWEAGGGIRWENVKRLAKVFGSDPDYVMNGPRERTPDLLGQWDEGDVPAWAQQIIESQRELRTMLLVILAHFQLQEDHRRLDEAERSTQPQPAATQKKKAAA